MASNRGLTLQPYFQERYIAGDIEAFRWRLEVVEAREMPRAIFLYRKIPTMLFAAGTGGTEPPVEVAWAGDFNGVASPVDLEAYPEGEPRVDEYPPFYRLDFLDQAFRSKQQGLRAFEATRRQVLSLIRTLDIMDELQALPPIVLGAPLPETP
jgi:hypothetical protein